MRRGGRGFTLIELAVVTAITGIILAGITGWVGDQRSFIRQGDAELGWARASAGAFRRLAMDARGAASVRAGVDAIRMRGGSLARPVTWRVEGHELLREGPGGRLAFTGAVRGFSAAVRGHRLSLRLDFAQRFGPYRARARHETSVALRGAGS